MQDRCAPVVFGDPDVGWLNVRDASAAQARSRRLSERVQVPNL